MALIASSCSRVIVGLGKTGLSCVRYLAARGMPFAVMDSRENPPGLAELRRDYPDVPLYLGGFDPAVLNGADELVVSPGVALASPELADALARGVAAIGDIELFCRAVRDKPVVAITGSNGKSTVTTLLGLMARRAGVAVAVGGNIGTPALDLLEQDAELYILELSSFQLETTHSLAAAAATVLNVSADHMDRYSSMVDYQGAKQRIYRGCKQAVYNRDDPLSAPLLPAATPVVTFSGGSPEWGQFGVQTDPASGQSWLCKGDRKLLAVAQLRIFGRHNQMNALAALALGEAVGLAEEAMLEALQDFPGLDHRCQWLAEQNQVSWFNDSKATNVGACIAAIEGLASGIGGQLILIAGGDGKGADFSALRRPVCDHVRQLILIGRDAPIIARQLKDSTVITHAGSLAEAVVMAQQASQPGDAVLLAPACASFDMFTSFEHRGDEFCRLVHEQLEAPRPC